MNQYKTEHLILLVGSNPLPNVVAANMLLVTPHGIITLLHSHASFAVAQQLESWLKRCVQCNNVRLKEIDESDPVSVFCGVTDELQAVGKISVGLHYTGGTKAMAVHAYNAVKHWVTAEQNKGCNVIPVFSYLNRPYNNIFFALFSGMQCNTSIQLSQSPQIANGH